MRIKEKIKGRIKCSQSMVVVDLTEECTNLGYLFKNSVEVREIVHMDTSS